MGKICEINNWPQGMEINILSSKEVEINIINTPEIFSAYPEVKNIKLSMDIP